MSCLHAQCTLPDQPNYFAEACFQLCVILKVIQPLSAHQNTLQDELSLHKHAVCSLHDQSYKAYLDLWTKMVGRRKRIVSYHCPAKQVASHTSQIRTQQLTQHRCPLVSSQSLGLTGQRIEPHLRIDLSSP